MSGNNIFVDTNILLYLLSGDETVAELLNGKHITISFVTELELLGYKDLSESEQNIIQEIIKEATITDINTEIKRLVILLRKKYRIKLPDAIVVASAIYANLPLVTADKRLSLINELSLLLYTK
jgi:predicted nucleic acid-binding protein